MVEYRPIRGSEIPAWRALEEYAFLLSPTRFEPFMQHVFQIDQVRGLFDEAGFLVATLVLDPFQIHWEGATLPMGGIASVASPPESRRRGYVRQIMTEALAEMKERGMALSALYPFEEAFYRRLGWGDAATIILHSIPVGQLRPLQRVPGHIRRLPGGSENWAAFDSIYTRWAAVRRGMIVRGNETHWRRRVNGPSKQMSNPMHAAIWSPNPGAEPEGYMLYQIEAAGDGHQFAIREWVALTPSAFEGLLGFAANHDSRVHSVTIKTLPDLPLWHLLDAPLDLKNQAGPAFQLRLVDLKAAFSGRPWPGDVNGSLTIGVTDEQAPWNSGTWRITFEGGHAEASSTRIDSPDLTASAEVWSQIYAGSLLPQQALRLGRMTAASPASIPLLTRAMAGDPLYFFEFF